MLIKKPLLHQSLGPHVFLSFVLSLSLSLSLCVCVCLLSLYFCLIPWSAKAGCIIQEILVSFFLSLFHLRLRTTWFQSNIGPTSGAQKQGLATRGVERGDPRGPIEASKY